MKRHFYTVALVCLMVLAAWWLGLMPAQAQIVGPVQPASGGGGTGCNTSGTSILKGNNLGGCSNAVAGTDFAAPTSGTAVLKGNGAGGFASAVAGTDYAPITSGTAILKGNNAGGFSNAASGTDYAPATSGTAILKGNGLGGFSNAVSSTDYAPATAGSSILKGNNLGGFANATSGTDYAPATSGSSILKGNGVGGFSNAAAGTDYAPATSGSSILKGNGAGSFANAVSGTDYAPATSGSSLLKGNGSGGFSNAVSGTDYQAPISGNTLSSHNFANSISSAGTITGAQPAFTDISGTAAASQGGTGTTYGAPGAYNQWTNAAGGTTTNSLYVVNSSQQAVNVAAGATSGVLGICDSGCSTSGTGTFFSGPGMHTCNFDGGVTAQDYVTISASVNGDCTDAGAGLPTGTELVGQVAQASHVGAGAYTVFFYGPDFPGTGGGGVNTPTQAGNPGYYNAGSAVMSGVGAEINIRSYLTSNPSDPLQAALSACPQISWVASTGESVGNVIADSNGDTEYVEACSGSCTTKTGSHPTWPTSAIANVGTQTVDNTGANQVTWEMIALGKYAYSGPCKVMGNSNDTYPIPNAVIISTGTAPVYLVDHGADYNCTETGGAGHACIVEGNLGHVVGNGQGSAGASVGIGNSGSTNLDSDVEGLSGYLNNLPTNPITNFKQTSFDIRNIDVLPGGTAIHKAALWIPGVEGQGRAKEMYIGGGGPAGITDVLVDDTVQSWNGIQLLDLWVGMAGAGTGIDVECGTHGGAGMVISGWVVDPSNNSATWIKVNGSNTANCVNGHIVAPYLEGAAGSSGTGILLNDTQAWTVTAMECLSGSETNCVKVTGLEADLHVDGFNGFATNAVNDTNYNYTNTSQGSFVYAPPVNGATLISNNNAVSSTANITMNPLINKYTISGNATFTFAKAAGGNDGFFATATAPVTFGFEVCQNATGNFTETFNNPSGGTLYWSGGAQPGYTLTASNGDFYSCFYNGTNVYCKETMSNVPCA